MMMGRSWYAIRHTPMVNGQRPPMIFMHHMIMGKPPEGMVNDHEDGNGLNNQRYNLRHVTVRQNGQNMKHGSRSSKYPGVCWHKKDKKWVALIRINGPQKWLGSFENEIDAYNAYCQAVSNLGEYVLKGEY